MEGNVRPTVPPPMRPTRNEYDWDSFAIQAQENPGEAVMAYENVPESRVKSVRYYDRPPFNKEGGELKIYMRNSAIGDDGIRRGEVWFQWISFDQEEEGK